MLYEALAGATPFQADTLPELVFKVTTTEPRPLKERRPDLPTSLTRLVDWAIARQRDQRLPDLRALIRELEPFARDRGVAQQMTNPDADAPRLAVRAKASELSPTANTLPLAAAGDVASVKAPEHDTFKARILATQQRQRKRSPLVWVVGAAAVAVAAAVALWLREPTQPDSPLPVSASAPTPAVQSEQAPPPAAPIASAADAPAEPRPVASGAPAAELALEPGKTSELQAEKAPPPPAAVPIKPASSARAPQMRQPAPAATEPAAQPQSQRPTQSGKTAAEVLAF